MAMMPNNIAKPTRTNIIPGLVLRGGQVTGIRESIAEMNKLRDQALQLGEKVGHFDEIVESNKWLKDLLAMVKGEEGVGTDQMRVILMTVTKAAIAWLDRHTEDTAALWIIRPSITRLIGDMERWKV